MTMGGYNTTSNHPVVEVIWQDALAYCQWLTEKLRSWEHTPEPLATLLREQGGVVTLPSEAEWKKAARGGLQVPRNPMRSPNASQELIPNKRPNRMYPWEGEFDADEANIDETGLGTTSAAGCFPAGSSPYEILDLSGNVWE